MFHFVAKKTIDLSPNKELGELNITHTLTTFFLTVARNRPLWYFTQTDSQ